MHAVMFLLHDLQSGSDDGLVVKHQGSLYHPLPTPRHSPKVHAFFFTVPAPLLHSIYFRGIIIIIIVYSASSDALMPCSY